MPLPKNNFQIKSYSDGDDGGEWQILNEKGDGLKTTEDYEGVEDDLQQIADALNNFKGKLWVETALELNLHCDHQMAKMELDFEKDRSQKLAKALLFLVDDVKRKPNDTRYATAVKQAEEALNEYNNRQTVKP